MSATMVDILLRTRETLKADKAFALFDVLGKRAAVDKFSLTLQTLKLLNLVVKRSQMLFEIPWPSKSGAANGTHVASLTTMHNRYVIAKIAMARERKRAMIASKSMC
jgi:hypothetical protein